MAPPNRYLVFHLPRTAVVRVLALAVAVSVMLVGFTGLVEASGDALRRREWWMLLAPQATLAGERSMAVWAASLTLMLVALTCGLAFFAERRAGTATRGSWAWLVMLAGFAALSLDEVGSLHERAGDYSTLNLVGGSQTWAGVIALPLTVAIGALAVFAWSRLRRHPLVAGLLLLGAALFVTVPLQEELESTQWAERAAAAELANGEMAGRAWYMTMFEEGTELAGSLAFLAAGLIYLHRAAPPSGARSHRGLGGFSVTLKAGELRTAARWATAALATGLALAAAMHLWAPNTPERGDPLPWFAAIAGLLAGAAAWLLPAQRGWLDPRAVLSVACLFWSVDQGAVFALTDGIWEGSPRVQLGTRLLLGAAAAAVAAYVARAQRSRRLQGRILAWGTLAAVAPVSGHPVAISALLFGAHALLLMGLVDHYFGAEPELAVLATSASTTRSPAQPSHPSGRAGR